MVKEGEFVDFAANLSIDNLSTDMQIIVELAKRIKELEVRLKALEDAKL